MGRWEEHEDFNGESMENGVRMSKMFFLLWELRVTPLHCWTIEICC